MATVAQMFITPAMRKNSSLTTITLLAIAILFASLAQSRARVIQIDPGTFAAIAYSQSTGRFGYSYNYRSRAEAESEALRHCGAPDAQIACWVNNGFCALAFGDDRSTWGVGYYYGSGSTNNDAEVRALAEARARTTNVYIAVPPARTGNTFTREIDRRSKIGDGRSGSHLNIRHLTCRSGESLQGYIGRRKTPTA
jgi:hypothetical protein